jgi:DNA-binding CsgD family transcriptional regulator
LREAVLAQDRQQLRDEIDRLVGAAARLADEARVVGLAVEAIWHACPQSLALAFTRRPDSGRYGAAAICRTGEAVPCPSMPPQRWCPELEEVPSWQRDRWIEPIAAGLHPPEYLSETHPVRAALPWVHARTYGRMLVCHAGTMVAWIGAYATGRPDFSEAERTALAEVAGRILEPLRAAALVAGGLPRQSLTARQRELVQCVARGMTNKEIARTLGISSGTVKTMLERLYRAARVSSRAALVARYGRPRL